MHKLPQQETFPAYVARLSAYGLRSVGHGMFSKVFQHPTLQNVVIKVVSNRDYNYLRFLKWAAKQPHNPYVPTIYATITCGPARKRFTIVFMEKLKSLGYGRANRLLDELFREKGVIDLLDPESPGQVRKLLRRTIRSSNDENLQEVCKYVLKHHGGNTDMHYGNFMLRGRQLVFTDPVMTHFEYAGSDFPDPLWVCKDKNESGRAAKRR